MKPRSGCRVIPAELAGTVALSQIFPQTSLLVRHGCATVQNESGSPRRSSLLSTKRKLVCRDVQYRCNTPQERAGKTNCAHDLRDHPCITAQLFENCLHEQRTGGASSKKKQPWIPSFPHQGTNTGDGRYGKAHCRKPRYPALSCRTRRNCTSAQQVLDGNAQGKQGERCHDKEKQWPYAIFGSQACHVRTR